MGNRTRQNKYGTRNQNWSIKCLCTTISNQQQRVWALNTMRISWAGVLIGGRSGGLGQSAAVAIHCRDNQMAYSSTNRTNATNPRTLFRKSSFIPRTSQLWNSLPLTTFPEPYNLSSFKSNINKLDLISLSS